MKNLAVIAITVIVCAIGGTVFAPDAYAKKTRKAKPRTTAAASKPRTASDIKRERTNTAREITETRRKIDDNKRATQRRLNQLNDLNSRIFTQNRHISSLQITVDSLNRGIASMQDSIQGMEALVDSLRADVAVALRRQRARRRQANNLAFVFASKDFNMAVRRIGYLKQLNRHRVAKITRLREAIAQLDSRRNDLNNMLAHQTDAINRLSIARNVLVTQQNRSQQMVNDLRRQGSSLQEVLAQRRRRMQQLDRELDRIVAEEQRRIAREQEEARRRERQRQQRERERQQQNRRGQEQPSKPTAPKPPMAETTADAATRKLTGSFEANKGRMPFPVSGKYTITATFGTQTYEGLTINSSGIEMNTAPGTRARAVFAGTVRSICYMAGMNMVIIITHGKYLTIYGGIGTLNVKKGDQVVTGQALGTLFTDKVENVTRLHFEVRRGAHKLNPLEWVAR